MKSQFEYNYQLQSQNSIDVPDIGNCALEGKNTLYEYTYYLIIFTKVGKTHLIECGPILDDGKYIPNDFQISYNVFDYSEKKIEKEINNFLNNNKKKISQVSFLEIEEAIEHITDFRKYVRDLYDTN